MAYISFFNHEDNWQDVKNATMNTIGKEKGAYPNSFWKLKLLRAEHSPIRKLMFSWRWKDLPYWVSVHFVRHKFGIEHFVKTQRTDRTGTNRDELPQGSPVSHECAADAQALINISRKRLCSAAAAETREAWQLVKNEVAKVEPELASCMVRECIYRGHCPEMFGCGFDKTEQFKVELALYRDLKAFIAHNGYTVAVTIPPQEKAGKTLVRCYVLNEPGDYFIPGEKVTEFDLFMENTGEKAIIDEVGQYMDRNFIAKDLLFVFKSHGKYVAVWKYTATVGEVKESGYDGEPLVDANGNTLSDDDIIERGVTCLVFNSKADIALEGDRYAGDLWHQFDYTEWEEIGDMDDPNTKDEIVRLVNTDIDRIEKGSSEN